MPVKEPSQIRVILVKSKGILADISRNFYQYSMQISYFGLEAFKISNKNFTAILNPYSKESGLTPMRGNADLIMLSEAVNPLYSYTQGFSGEPFIIDTPGEFDTKDFTVTGIPIRNGGKLITAHLIQTEGITILNLGHISELKLNEDELEDLGDVDILLLPVGGHDVLDYDAAAKAANMIEPKIIIPMDYMLPGIKLELNSNEKFLRQIGGKFETLDKLSLKKKDLVEDGVKVIVLEPAR
jgi:hypothetical protein